MCCPGHATCKQGDISLVHPSRSTLHVKRPCKIYSHPWKRWCFSALKSGSTAAGGLLYGLPTSFLQTTYSPRIFFTTCLPLGTQYFDLNSANMTLTPLWYTLWWHSSMNNLVNLCCRCKISGLLASNSRSELTNLLSHLKVSLSSFTPSSLTSCLKFSCFFRSSWANLTHSTSALFNSATLTDLCA